MNLLDSITSSKHNGWSQTDLAQYRKIVKHTLSQLSSPNEKINFVMDQVLKASSSDVTEAAALQYVLIMYALILHEKHRLLENTQVKFLRKLATATLKANQIKPGTSNLSHLYADLHSVCSQINRRRGSNFNAAWEEAMASRLTPERHKSKNSFKKMLLANRMLRLGKGPLALKLFSDCESHEFPKERQFELRFRKMHTLWLTGNIEQSDQNRHELQKIASKTKKFEVELRWLQVCRELQETHNAHPMLRAIGSRGTHHEPGYIIEGLFWLSAMPQKKLLGRLPKLSYLSKKKTLNFKSQEFWFDAAKVILSCYDTSIPIHWRLDQLGSILNRRNELKTIDKELLLLASATRFCIRFGCDQFAALAYSEYKGLCTMLSNGQNTDILGIMDDLTERSSIIKNFESLEKEGDPCSMKVA